MQATARTTARPKLENVKRSERKTTRKNEDKEHVSWPAWGGVVRREDPPTLHMDWQGRMGCRACGPQEVVDGEEDWAGLDREGPHVPLDRGHVHRPAHLRGRRRDGAGRCGARRGELSHFERKRLLTPLKLHNSI